MMMFRQRGSRPNVNGVIECTVCGYSYRDGDGSKRHSCIEYLKLVRDHHYGIWQQECEKVKSLMGGNGDYELVSKSELEKLRQPINREKDGYFRITVEKVGSPYPCSSDFVVFKQLVRDFDSAALAAVVNEVPKQP